MPCRPSPSGSQPNEPATQLRCSAQSIDYAFASNYIIVASGGDMVLGRDPRVRYGGAWTVVGLSSCNPEMHSEMYVPYVYVILIVVLTLQPS